MSRLDRLELVVRNITDRVLGEEYTFDAIAAQEAEEQGVVYTPPPAVPIQVDSFDPAPLLAEIAEIKKRLSAADSRNIQQEKMLQTVIQAADALLQRIQAADQRLDQHRDVINANQESSLKVLEALATNAEMRLKERDAA